MCHKNECTKPHVQVLLLSAMAQQIINLKLHVKNGSEDSFVHCFVNKSHVFQHCMYRQAAF